MPLRKPAVAECEARIGPETAVRYLKGVGPARAALLEREGIATVEDLLRAPPRGYLDRRTVRPIEGLLLGETATIEAQVREIWTEVAQHRRLVIVKATVADATGEVLAIWFNQPWVAEQLRRGERWVLAGKAVVREVRGARLLQFEVEDHERVGEADPLHAQGYVPRYAHRRELPGKLLQRIVRDALDGCAGRLDDPLPEPVRRRRGLIDLAAAVRSLHAPDAPERVEPARRRMAYEELFLLQSALAISHRELARAWCRPVPVDDALDARIRRRFPVTLTGAQERAVRHIREDLARAQPMHRLLQGDVGCGKTYVAAYAILAAIGNRRQAALMAPTGILAEQHRATFERIFAGSKVRVGFLAGSVRGSERKAVLEGAAAGEIDLVVGTHALVEEDVKFRDLAVAVIDEQQKFGVLQRSDLVRKGWNPHVLVVTATPIPRTLALTLFGDLEVTTIDEMPPGRRPVATEYYPASQRAEAMARIRGELEKGRQAYVVYPLIDESDRVPLRSAKAMHVDLSERFPEFDVGLLHGAMTARQKERVMAQFRAGKTAALVSTIVVEVGVDVPNATVMVIDHAERYGLSQLHQLRGRIGRGAHESVCVLIGEPSTPEARARLDAVVRHADGFRLAEEDLRIRGPGDFLGARQSGLPEFRYADLVRDARLVVESREDAWGFVRSDPGLSSPAGARLRRALRLRHGGRLALLRSG